MADETLITEGETPEQEITEPSEGTLVTTEEGSTEAPDEAETKTDTEDKGDEEEQGAPEQYEDFTLPQEMMVDERLMGEFTPLAKELNLTQEGAQKLVDLQTQAKLREVEQWNQTRQDWRQQAQADSEIGGGKFQEAVADAKAALKEFGSDDLREFIEYTGAGDNPHFIKFIAKVGAQMRESGYFGTGDQATSGERDLAKILFPDQN